MSDRLATILLPGLDGTGDLFAPLLEVFPETLEPFVISYPPDQLLGYRELEEFVAAKLPADRDFAIVAESFSGPLAARLAGKCPAGLRGLVLVASFVANPSWGMLRYLQFLVRSPLFRFSLPGFAIRCRLVGPDAPDQLVAEVAAAIRTVRPVVMARRVREVLRVDASESFAAVRVPILYLLGEQDRQVGARVADELGEARPDMEIVSIPAPHLILQCEPLEAARRIGAFLKSQSS